jgi:hypothetical protein
MNKNFLPPTTKKAALNTCDKINQDIRAQTVACINTFKDSGEAVISDNIEKLNREWDTERILETSTAATVIMGSICGLKKNGNCFLVLTGAAGFFLLQHALQGWCPSLPCIRKAGFRTAEEINNEKTVFKILRGDFQLESRDANELLGMTEK